MHRFFKLWSSKARFILFLFSLLGATALYCNQAQYKRVSVNRNIDQDQNAQTKSALPSMMASLSSHQVHTEQDQFSKISAMLLERTLGKERLRFRNPRKKRRCHCPDDYDDDNNDIETQEDRREALFAMMGGLWATTTAASSSAALFGFPDPSLATAGTDAKMEFPDVMAGMNDRATKQCLVESLGNRECLVYKETDPDKLLYKGANAQILVDRTKKASDALKEIPSLVEKKKWNDINGLLIGPMGELSSTLTLLCGDDDAKIKLARKVKDDLFAMGTATTQRQQEAILKYHAAATIDLAKFLAVAL